MISGINITPFTDVILVLLIVFMVSAPGLLSSSLNIVLPGSSTASSRVPSALVVALDREGHLYVDGKSMESGALEAKVKQIGKDAQVTLNADARATHGRVVEVMDLLRRAGAEKIYVGTVNK